MLRVHCPVCFICFPAPDTWFKWMVVIRLPQSLISTHWFNVFWLTSVIILKITFLTFHNLIGTPWQWMSKCYWVASCLWQLSKSKFIKVVSFMYLSCELYVVMVCFIVFNQYIYCRCMHCKHETHAAYSYIYLSFYINYWIEYIVLSLLSVF